MRTEANNGDPDCAVAFSTYLNRLKMHNSVSMSANLKSMYRNWFKQLREADAFLHASPSFISAIVPDIMPTRGNRSALPRPEMIERDKNPFMTREITDYLQKTEVTHWLKYAASNIRGRSVVVHILHCGGGGGGGGGVSLKQLKTYLSYVYKIYAWFHFIHPYQQQQQQQQSQSSNKASSSGNECSKEINLYFYFTPFKKLLPCASGETLGPTHANTGFTYPCGINPGPGGKKSTEIIIFRHEEWFKVLMHETFHNLELDFNIGTGTSLRDVFPGIRHDVLMSEAYVESWARILNVAFYVFYDIYGGNGTAAQYNAAIARCLPVERAFSLFQAIKTLKYMELTFSDIVNPDPAVSSAVDRKYAEDTNIFAYYILAGMLVFNADEFLQWCISTNTISLMQATHGMRGTSMFKHLISSLCKNERILDNIHVFETAARQQQQQQQSVDATSVPLQTTFRMTIWS